MLCKQGSGIALFITVGAITLFYMLNGDYTVTTDKLCTTQAVITLTRPRY